MNRRKNGTFWWISGVCLVVFLVLFIAFSPLFERQAPQSNLHSPLYWNFKTPLNIKITDNRSLGYYKVEIHDMGKEITLAEGTADKGQKELNLTLTYPKNAFLPSSSEAKIVVTAKDRSLWHFFGPNTLEQEIPVICDNTAPVVSVVANSYSIARGGSAFVVFQAKDDNLKAVFIRAGNKLFHVQPFLKKGYYAALIAWDIKDQQFAPTASATDTAGNETDIKIPFFFKDIAYKDSRLELKDDFLNQKIIDLSKNMKATPQTTALQKFAYVNNDERGKDERLIHQITNRMGTNTVDGFFADPFIPITRASVVATFGDHRSYYFGTQLVSESFHKGLDLASTKNAPILAPNNGVVVFTGNNGIYGNMVVLYHGLGLFTLYGHCSEFTVKQGDVVKRGQQIAKTGMTGLAFGDHLHYGILIQGVEVRPVEWLDPQWIKLNITNIVEQAKNQMATQK